MAAAVSIGRKRGRSGWSSGVEIGEEVQQHTRSANGEDTPSLSQNTKKKRGRTCLQVMATGENERKLVEWNARGQPIGKVSVNFSSTLGVIIREKVPITLKDWHEVKDKDRDNLWKLLMQKYVVDVCYKPFVLQQMGRLWRSWKSDLSVDIRKIEESKSTMTERVDLLAKLKPHDVSQPEWDKFVQSRMSHEWHDKSKKMRAIRAKQVIAHTMSRSGYARVEDNYNKQHPDQPLTKPALWIKGHEKSQKPAVKAKIAEIQAKIDKPPTNDDGVTIEEDILTEVLGKERPGRVRGLGAGVTKTKLNGQSLGASQFQQLAAELKAQNARTKKLELIIAKQLGINLDSIDDDADVISAEHEPVISKNQVDNNVGATPEVVKSPRTSGQDSTHQPTLFDKCKVLNWIGNGEVVAMGYLSATDPKSTVHGYTLGPDCYRIFIDDILVEKAEFYRTEPEFANLEDARGSTIAWPIKYLDFDVEP